MTITAHPELEGLERYRFGWTDSDVAGESARRGLSEEVVRDISALKDEPEWMLDLRLKGLKLFRRKPMPSWGADLTGIDFDNIKYFVRSTEKQATSWDDLPADIKSTYDRLGIPEAEKQRLIAGVAAQYESEVVYHMIREDLAEKGVIFLDTDTALKEYPDLFQEYFATIIPVGDNKFAALNTAVWSGGSFMLRAEGRARGHPAAGLLPDQHREHGPIRADADHRRRGRQRALRRGLHRAGLLLRLAALRGRRDHREERCPLPVHHDPELVEQRLQPGHQAGRGPGRGEHGVGGRKYRLEGDDEVPSGLPDGRALQGGDPVRRVRRGGPAPGRRRQDGALCAAHLLPDHLQVRGQSCGRTSYRGLVQVQDGAAHSKSTVKCDALLVDTVSRSDTYPYVDIREDDVEMGHEASVSKISEDQLFYLMSRGMTEDEAAATIVRGFVEPIARELPMEYALELNRLIELQMEGAVG